MDQLENGTDVTADERYAKAEPDRLDYLEARVRLLEERVPDTQLLNQKFMPRAFAVLGHYIVAGAIVYVAVVVVIAALSAFGIGALSLGGLLGR